MGEAMTIATFELSAAAAEDIAAVAGLLQDTARWIMTWRSRLWDPDRLGEAFVTPLVGRGEVLTARIGGEIAAMVILQPDDPHFWPERPPGEAIYLHKLVVRRAYAGQGAPAALIDHAVGVAQAQGRRFLRLDCDRPLSPVYQRLGFR
ncbi:MAG TPA: GNAT family N-acetyltransferase, partial [Phenylobacterium sp.]